MNPFEKLLMVVFPSMGLAGILYFFTWYLPDVENGNFTESQRLQGTSYPSKVVYHKSDTLTPMNTDSSAISPMRILEPTSHNDVKRGNSHKKASIKWHGENNVTHISESLKHRSYKQTNNYVPQPVYNNTNNNLQAEYAQKIRLQQQAQARKQKKLDKQMNDRKCAYIEEMKERAEDRMKRGYRASEYNHLEKKRKYWAKKYANNCFDGIRYPR
ncbi:hypothetical protein OO007_13490 [Cocleimonas sp. KMM 6892]|uniref:hypothetical protein n=1 Tax=unclassified Cocleimonas TaxID=2639732 RepID=UPI002DB84CDA|nr:MULTISPECIES: hypothetical protein [unclassified Cocleimonas]MEB8433246.1 hypothetical protein [Cocleimonas sp. KMM 6892]MEC4715773.1 hypothetical protein [Cocleimonas sp. KMM 6895]MEC4745234.1 hypothetical protein [Cocleimonas sp. KMM 6896]